MRRARLGWLVAAAVATGCGTPSHALDPKERDALAGPEKVEWRPATKEDVVGYFESERIEGEAAGSLRRVLYAFAADGSYSGAALVQESKTERFQVLSGTWTFADGALRLSGDDAPAKAFAAPNRLRLDAEGGSAVFRRTVP